MSAGEIIYETIYLDVEVVKVDKTCSAQNINKHVRHVECDIYVWFPRMGAMFYCTNKTIYICFGFCYVKSLGLARGKNGDR